MRCNEGSGVTNGGGVVGGRRYILIQCSIYTHTRNLQCMAHAVHKPRGAWVPRSGRGFPAWLPRSGKNSPGSSGIPPYAGIGPKCPDALSLLKCSAIFRIIPCVPRPSIMINNPPNQFGSMHIAKTIEAFKMLNVLQDPPRQQYPSKCTAKSKCLRILQNNADA